jgi:hypothetical protein
MVTDVHPWPYVTQFFLEWEKFTDEFLYTTKTRILYSKTFFQKSCRLKENAQKYGSPTVRQATDDIIRSNMAQKIFDVQTGQLM